MHYLTLCDWRIFIYVNLCHVLFSYIKSADKVFLKAQDYDLEGDEEYAYVYYMRYYTIISLIKRSTKYSDNKVSAQE